LEVAVSLILCFVKDDYTSKLKQKIKRFGFDYTYSRVLLVLLQGDGWKITRPLKEEDMSEASSSSIGEIIRQRSVPSKYTTKISLSAVAKVKC